MHIIHREHKKYVDNCVDNVINLEKQRVQEGYYLIYAGVRFT